MWCSRRAFSALTVALAAVFLFLVAAVPSFAQQRVYNIGLTYPFPPWDVGPLEGVDYDLLTAICEANGPMHCMLEALPSEACVDTGTNGHMIIGWALATGRIDGCVAWYGTEERKRLGITPFCQDLPSHASIPWRIISMASVPMTSAIMRPVTSRYRSISRSFRSLM